MNSKTREYLAGMVKALPKQSARQYVRWIGIEGNMAAITDGYGMLVLESQDLGTEAKVLDSTLGEVQGVKYPNYRAILPKDSGNVLPNDAVRAVMLLVENCKAKRDVYLRVDGSNISLVTEVANDSAEYFQPYIINSFLKGLPKAKVFYGISGAAVVGTTLVLSFGVNFKLIVTAMRKDT